MIRETVERSAYLSGLGGGVVSLVLLWQASDPEPSPLKRPGKSAEKPYVLFSQPSSGSGQVSWREADLSLPAREGRTPLWRKLMALRAQALAGGMPTKSRDEILVEMRKERGEEGDG